MRDRSPYLAGLLLASAALIPAAAHADIRIEERSQALDSTVTRWIMIKGDRRAVVTRSEPGGVLFNAGARYGAHVEIARPDKELIWQLDPQEKKYKEFSAAQFTRLLQKGTQAPRSAADQPLRTLYRSETTAVEVRPTGLTKRIAGLPAEQVLARVVVGAQNQQSGNKLRFTFDQEIWITRDERLMQELRGFEEAYVDAFGSAASLAQAQVMAGEWNDAFITHLRALNDKVRALGGYPVMTSTTVTEEALAQDKDEQSTSRKLVLGSTDVKRISLDSIPDSEFELPGGYINEDTKVAVNGPLGGRTHPFGDDRLSPAPAPGPRLAAQPKPAAAPGGVPAPAPSAPAPSAPVIAAAPVRREVQVSREAPAFVPAPNAIGRTALASAPAPATVDQGSSQPRRGGRKQQPAAPAVPVLAAVAPYTVASNYAGDVSTGAVVVDELEALLSPKSKKKRK